MRVVRKIWNGHELPIDEIAAFHETVERAAIAACVIVINAAFRAFGKLLHNADVALHWLELDVRFLQQIRDSGRAEFDRLAIDGELVYLDVAEGLRCHIICAIDAVIFAVEGERPSEIKRLVVLAEKDDII